MVDVKTKAYLVSQAEWKDIVKDKEPHSHTLFYDNKKGFELTICHQVVPIPTLFLKIIARARQKQLSR